MTFRTFLKVNAIAWLLIVAVLASGLAMGWSEVSAVTYKNSGQDKCGKMQRQSTKFFAKHPDRVSHPRFGINEPRVCPA